MKKIISFTLLFFLCLSLVSCKKSKPVVCINVEEYGKIYVELDPNEAPKTVENFLKLINKKFYDGLTFHRIMPVFMIQGGDPNGDGSGGSKDKVKGEFSANGYENNIKHTRGTISMARSTDYNSASSQFFIVHKTNKELDGQYAAFGHVIKGMNVVDEIAEMAEPTDNDGTIEKNLQPVIKSIRVVHS